MEKPKALSEYTLIEQEFVTNALNELLNNHKDDSYSTFYHKGSSYYGGMSHETRESKNIYFYVPELNKFFFVTTDHILKDLEFRFPNESVRDRLLNYSKNEVFSIDELADCRYGYYCSFSDRSIIYPEIIEKFKEKNPYSAIYEYEDLVERNQDNDNYRYYRRIRYDTTPVELLGYALLYLKYPQVEKMFKTGFERFVVDWVHNPSDSFPRNFKNGNNLNEITKLPKFAWQLLKDEGITDINKWNEFRIWVQKDGLSKEQLETILNLRIRDTATIKAIRSILNTEYNNEKLYTLDSLLNYLSRVDMHQAIPTEEAIIILRDYLKMAIECDVKPITNSNSLKREHDVVMKNHRILLNAKREEYQASLGVPFKERSEELSKYEYRDNELQVIAPREMEDLLKEGRNNNNCVGGYIERFAKGTSNIFFIRKNEDPERSYITIEVNNDFSGVRQAYYSSNREITKQSDIAFIDNWINHIKEIYKGLDSVNQDKDIADEMF